MCSSAVRAREMNHIIVDIEATCWKGWRNENLMETIEIGGVKLNGGLEPMGEFNALIRPVIEPKLSDFCIRLTSIQQADVDDAETFTPVFNRFVKWIGREPFVWYSWGNFDRKQLERDCRKFRRRWPASLNNHQNLKQLFATYQKLDEPIGMMRALKRLSIEPPGRYHRALDDARSTAKIAQQILAQETD